MSDGKFKVDQQLQGTTIITEGTFVVSGNSLTITRSSGNQTYTFTVSESELSLATPGLGGCTYTSFWSK